MAHPIIDGARAVIRAMAWIGGIGILVLMLPTLVDVTNRGLFGPSVPGMVEYSESGLVVVIFLGIASALTDGVHIHTPLLTSKLSPPLANTLRLFGRCLMWVICALVLYGTILDAYDSFIIREFRFGLIEVPIWPAKSVIPVGFAALLMEISIQIFEYARAIGQESKLGQNRGNAVVK